MYKVHRYIDMKHVVIDIYKQNSSLSTLHSNLYELFFPREIAKLTLVKLHFQVGEPIVGFVDFSGAAAPASR